MIVLIVITLLSLVHGETNDKKGSANELENEVLIKKLGYFCKVQGMPTPL